MKPQLVDARSETDFERGHFAGAVLLAPDAVLVFAGRELPLKSRAPLIYGAYANDEAALQTAKELQRLGFQAVEVAPYGFDDNPEELGIEVGSARWEITGCGG